jgi:DNA polymerase/3'-5' exonuclease PolX
MNNQTIAERLLEHARTLESEGANLYRIQAYRRAAETVQRVDRPVADIITTQGRVGLSMLPAIGSHISYTIEQLVNTGQMPAQPFDKVRKGKKTWRKLV